MKIQVNSDKTIAVDASLTRFVEAEVTRVLARFAIKLTRVEVHLSDVDSKKTGQADKRCLIEVRPAGARPRSASAKATKMALAVDEALGKIQRSLTTFFGRKGRPAAAVSAAVSPTKKAPVREAVEASPNLETKAKAAVKKTAAKKPAAPSSRRPKKKGIYQARRKRWPSR
jgi:ribosome-associated translation inhibitor RaiA